MSRTSQGSLKNRIRRADQLRPSVKQFVKERTIRVAEELSGISRTVLHDFISGSTPQEKNLGEIEAWAKRAGIYDPAGGVLQESPAPYNEAREEEELARIGSLPDSLLRSMERESIAAVIRAQGMRDACRAARIEAEKAPNRALPELSSDQVVRLQKMMMEAAIARRMAEGLGGETKSETPGSSESHLPDE